MSSVIALAVVAVTALVVVAVVVIATRRRGDRKRFYSDVLTHDESASMHAEQEPPGEEKQG